MPSKFEGKCFFCVFLGSSHTQNLNRKQTDPRMSQDGESVGEIPGCLSSLMWYGVMPLLDYCTLSHEYGDTLKTSHRPESIMQSLKVVHKWWDCRRAMTVVAWPLLWAKRHATCPELSAWREITYWKEELQLKRHMQVTSSTLASELAVNLDKRKNEIEVLACHFLWLGLQM